jgi:hypothetical protein
MVDQVLLELFSQFGTEDFEVLDLLCCFLGNFQDFIIDISRQEMSSFRIISSDLLDFFVQFNQLNIIVFFHLSNFISDVP